MRHLGDPVASESDQRARESVPRTEVAAASAPSSTYYQYEEVVPARIDPIVGRDHQETPQTRAPPDSEDELRLGLHAFYCRYNPAGIPRIDAIIERYRGRHAQLWRDLAEKYLVEEVGK